jgi:hypothetical protein
MATLTAAQVRAAIDKMEKDHLDKWWPLTKSLFVALCARIDALDAQLQKVGAGAYQLALEVKALRERDPASIAEAAPEVPDASEPSGTLDVAPEVPAGSPVVGADGNPLTPEQQRVEAEMNAAIAGGVEVVAPSAPPPPSRPAGGRSHPQQIRRAPQRSTGRASPAVTPSPAQVNGHDDQAAIEAQMDEAIAGMGNGK